MTALWVDPFADEQVGPPRDRHKRPLLIPAAGGERQPYTRMSTLADHLTSTMGLSTWERRLLAVGMAKREDICAMVAALPALNDAHCDKAVLTKEQIEQDKATKAKLDEYIEMAWDAAGKNWKADWGTAVHAFIENGDATHAPERMRPDVESALELFERTGIEILASERFVANDRLMAAGTFDHLARVPGWGVCIIDVKTGHVDGKGLAFATQLAGYVNGELYDWHDDSRAPLESLSGGERINRKVGFICHVPLGGARTQMYAVDLMTGAHCAQLATQVRKARSLDKLCTAVEIGGK